MKDIYFYNLEIGQNFFIHNEKYKKIEEAGKYKYNAINADDKEFYRIKPLLVVKVEK